MGINLIEHLIHKHTRTTMDRVAIKFINTILQFKKSNGTTII